MFEMKDDDQQSVMVACSISVLLNCF